MDGVSEDFVPLLDGEAVWRGLDEGRRAAVGAAALELAAALVGTEAIPDATLTPGAARRLVGGLLVASGRAFEAAAVVCGERLVEAVVAAVPTIDPDLPPFPAGAAGTICVACGGELGGPGDGPGEVPCRCGDGGDDDGGGGAGAAARPPDGGCDLERGAGRRPSTTGRVG